MSVTIVIFLTVCFMLQKQLGPLPVRKLNAKQAITRFFDKRAQVGMAQHDMICAQCPEPTTGCLLQGIGPPQAGHAAPDQHADVALHDAKGGAGMQRLQPARQTAPRQPAPRPQGTGHQHNTQHTLSARRAAPVAANVAGPAGQQPKPLTPSRAQRPRHRPEGGPAARGPQAAQNPSSSGSGGSTLVVGVKRPRRQDSVREELQVSPWPFVAASWASVRRALLMFNEVATAGAGRPFGVKGGGAGLLCCQESMQKEMEAICSLSCGAHMAAQAACMRSSAWLSCTRCMGVVLPEGHTAEGLRQRAAHLTATGGFV